MKLLTHAATLTSLLLLGACASKPAAPSALPPAAPTEALAAPAAPLPDRAPEQIEWQRSLDDALAIAAAEGRPLLVAINVDGESASDRIVVERYRDPAFVAWTRRFACVIGHPFRHTPRDVDERGERVLCPRLGNVTCGEHVANEPAVYERYLKDHERVSPRHALVRRDGTKAFDLFLLFDLRELDGALEREAAVAPAPAVEPRWNELPLSELAARRENAARGVLETLVGDLRTSAQRVEALGAIAKGGDAGSIGALRVVMTADRSEPVLAALEASARALRVEAQLAAAARDALFFDGALAKDTALPAEGALHVGFGEDAGLLGLVASLDGASRVSRTLLLAAYATSSSNDREMARAALATAFGEDVAARIVAAVDAEGGPVEVGALVGFARDVPAKLGPIQPRAKSMPPPREEAENELAAADEALSKADTDPAAMERFGRAALEVARARLEGGDTAGLDALFQDAQHWLGRAAEAGVQNDRIAVDRMRAAYYLSRFDEQERIAREALAGWPDALGSDVELEPRKVAADAWRAARCARSPQTLEALRWLGDASARLFVQRLEGDPAEAAAAMARGARALGIVAVSPEANEDDWTGFASFLSLLEMARGELAALRAGVLRLPEANGLRNLLNQALHRAGASARAGVEADRVLAAHPGSATAAWYSGYAWLLAAEDARRREEPAAALSAYATADERFAASLDLEPKFADTVKRHRALCAMGSGFAHQLAGDRAAAARSLVEALKHDATVGDVRDGLEREALDLVDASLEWTAKGPSPVDAIALARELAALDPKEPRWISAVTDSQLREALRADGRSPELVQREVTRQLANGETRTERRDVRVPAAEGDLYMERSIEIARLARAARDDEGTQRSLAQSLTVHGERWLMRGDVERARPLLVEAATLLGRVPASALDVNAIGELARSLRAELGPARPVARPGR